MTLLMTLHPLRIPGLPNEPAAADVDDLLAALDAMDSGVLISDARGRLLLFNQAARRELSDGGVLMVGADGMLNVHGGAGLLNLRRAVHGAAVLCAHHLLPLRVGERTLMLSVQPLGGADGPQRALLMTGRRSLCPELAVRHLGRVFALTPAEMEVLGSLLSGVRISAMAEARGVKLSTVRTQVAALRTKLGVRRVDDITRLVAELPPMPGVLGRYASAAALAPQPQPTPLHQHMATEPQLSA